MKDTIIFMQLEINLLSLLLILFALIFFMLFLVHIIIMMKKMKHFKATKLNEIKSEKNTGDYLLNQAIISIQNQMNEYIDDLNTTNKIIQRSSAIGYFTLFLISFLTFYLTL
jgi:hypothetical protein